MLGKQSTPSKESTGRNKICGACLRRIMKLVEGYITTFCHHGVHIDQAQEHGPASYSTLPRCLLFESR